VAQASTVRAGRTPQAVPCTGAAPPHLTWPADGNIAPAGCMEACMHSRRPGGLGG